MKLFQTSIINGPKRSGTALLNRLLDSHPELVDMSDEAFFWEHAARYDYENCSELYLDVFCRFETKYLVESFIDRDLLPWIEGEYRQRGGAKEADVLQYLNFDTRFFEKQLDLLSSCKNLSEVWNTLISSYANSFCKDYSSCKKVIFKTADYGLSILSARKHLGTTTNIFIMRNPFYSLDSLKRSRKIRGEKILHPINLAEAIRDYVFLWNNWESIFLQDTLLVYYEELLQFPEKIMHQVAEHIEIEFFNSLLKPTLQGGKWPGHSSFKAANGLDISMLDRELVELNETEISFIETHLSELLNAHGYTWRKQRPVK